MDRDAADDDRWEAWARLVRHPLRQRLLFKYAEAVTSPAQVAAALDEPLNLVSYHTRVLFDAGCLELVGTKRRRGATQHFYRTMLASEVSDAGWALLPVRLRRVLVRGTLDTIWDEAGDALPRGGLDDPLAHVSRSLFALDLEGRTELSELLKSTLASAAAIVEASRDRGPDGDVPYELVMLSFERASRP